MTKQQKQLASTITLSIAGLCILCSLPTVAAESKSPSKSQPAAAQPKKAKLQTFLFMDWNDVEKGRLVSVLDPNRLTEDAKKNIEQTRKDFGIVTHLGRHGTMSYHVPHGIRIAVEKATKTKRWLMADQPWEDDIGGGNVIYDEGRFRCWYSATIPHQKQGVVYVAEGRAMETNGSSTCYAESTDGIHWTKPALGIFSFQGSKSNNMVSPLWVDTPFRDDHGIPEERYKGFTFEELPADELPKGASSFSKYGLYGVVSPDGYHWTKLPKPLIRHFADTWNIAGWDQQLKKYVGYFRGHSGGRSITRAETDDFHNWPMPETVMSVGPEELPTEDYYSSGFTTYPGMPAIRLMFPGIFHLRNSLVDCRLAISRDGEGWNWVSHESILDIGAKGEWDAGMVFGQPNLLRLPDGRLALPYSGYNEGHDIAFSSQYKDWPKAQSGMAWGIWQEGRLAGIEADKAGEFHASMPLRDPAEIQINARTASRGRIEVELVERDTVLPGFSFADCMSFSGDTLWAPLRWKGKSDLSELKGKKVHLHFRLTCAKVFGYRAVN